MSSPARLYARAKRWRICRNEPDVVTLLYGAVISCQTCAECRTILSGGHLAPGQAVAIAASDTWKACWVVVTQSLSTGQRYRRNCNYWRLDWLETQTLGELDREDVGRCARRYDCSRHVACCRRFVKLSANNMRNKITDAIMYTFVAVFIVFYRTCAD